MLGGVYEYGRVFYDDFNITQRKITMETIKRIINSKTVLYVFFGMLTTVINYFCFWLFYRVLMQGNGSIYANIIAFVISVAFAFVVNKLFVFKSNSWSAAVLIKEGVPFVASRIFSFLIEEAGLFISEEIINANKIVIFSVSGISVDGVTLTKVALSVFVIILNYVFCNFFVFKRKE